MIPVLFKANAVDFSTFGIGVLADCISCEVTEERNGSYELVLQYPVTGRNYGELRPGRAGASGHRGLLLSRGSARLGEHRPQESVNPLCAK